MDQAISAPWFAGGLLVGMWLCIELGMRVRRAQAASATPNDSSRAATVDGSVFALFGLLLAFGFSGAATRFHDRQLLGAEEANAIGTAYLRLDLLPEASRPPGRELLRRYLDSRLATFADGSEPAAVQARQARSIELQTEIWQFAVAAVGADRTGPAGGLVLSALNEMFDIVTTRSMRARVHPPLPVSGLLFALGLACAFLVGWGMAPERDWVQVVAFPVAVAVTVFLIADMEYPRHGFIRLDAYDQVLVDLRKSMGD